MTHQEILTEAIEKAISNGWRPVSGRPVEDWLNFVEGMDCGFIFTDRGFARALWGEEETDTGLLVESQFQATSAFTDSEPHYLPAWQYHLQQMVVSDDPIQYLKENI